MSNPTIFRSFASNGVGLGLLILSSLVSPLMAGSQGEAIYRLASDASHQVEVSQRPPPRYPWEGRIVGGYPRITPHFFRCRGDSTRPLRKLDRGSAEAEYFYDCAGGQAHTLPLKDGASHIYPILVDLLNFVQQETRCRVVITCGHQCPVHQRYVSDTGLQTASKHLIGAEVDFYVEGYEENPEPIVDLVMQYYQDDADPAYSAFHRYQQGTSVRAHPWYNKEVFIKLYQSDEGRDLDNSHSHSYICIQVKYDRLRQQRVVYSWRKAQNYGRE